MNVDAFLGLFERFLLKLFFAICGGIYGAFVAIGVAVVLMWHPQDVAGLVGVAGFVAGAIGGTWGQKSFPKRIAWAGGLAALFGPLGGYLLLAILAAAGAPL